MKHTKEPWFTKCDDSGWFIDSEQDYIECTGERPVCINVSGVDATRIVECVNVCEGVENPQEAIKELVEVCEAVANGRRKVILVEDDEQVEFDRNIGTLRQALKKVKGKS